jgi:excisionase family DNA binding protein
MMEKMFLAKEDVAQLLGIHQRTVDNLVKAGKLPRSINVGRQLRWRKKDIENWVDTAFKSTSEYDVSNLEKGSVQS